MKQLILTLILALLACAQNTYIEGGIYQQIESYGALRLLNASAVTGPTGMCVLVLVLSIPSHWPDIFSSIVAIYLNLRCANSAAAAVIPIITRLVNTGKNAAGIVYQILSQDDLTAFLAFSPAFVSFAVVLPFTMFTASVVDALEASNKIAGIILVQNYSSSFPIPAFDSPDDPFPNWQFSLYANSSDSPIHVWNPNGSGLLHRQFHFPVFVMPVNPNDLSWPQAIGTLIETANYNLERGYTQYPLYSIELNEFMYGSIDSETCLRRGWCSPIGASSVWGTFSYNMSIEDTKNIVFLIAQADGNGFFYEFTNSAATVMAGCVSVLAAAEALSKNHSAVTSLPNDIIFALFSSEHFGFAGSQRFVKDISTPFTCLQQPTASSMTTSSCAYENPFCQNPCQITDGFASIGFDRISHIVEIGQVGGFGMSNSGGGSNNEIFLHVDDATDAETQALVNILSGNVTVANNGGIGNSTILFNPAFSGTNSNVGNNRLPPASAMAFLKKKKIPTVFLGDFKDEFSNPYYNSIFDDGSQVTSENIALMCGVATRTARSVFQLAGGSAADAAQFTANCTLVEELFTCFTKNATCSLIHSIYPVFSQQAFTTVPPYIMYNLLANYTAAKREHNACDSTQSSPSCTDASANCITNDCVWSQTNPHFAYGTGLEMDYSSGKFVVVNATGATWVQSGFNSTEQRIRTFLSSSPQYQGMQIGVGIALTVVTIVASYYAQKHVDAQFK
ncbi:hypothetical protein HK100_003543 [Physocladia obscura]|uniref:Nicastrin n=1 Tax=Physocladia obscura TaxID=109957 RepID=A0AAD5TFP8_9FUNG|nr:hypothetical protein HK100_003543 [Physocladia obscura]